MTIHSKDGTSGLTKLDRISELSARDKFTVFNNLGHIINLDLLKERYHELDGSKAVGIDGVTKECYGKQLNERFNELGVYQKMLSQSLFNQTKQDLICKHLESISTNVSDAEKIKKTLRSSACEFIVGQEIKSSFSEQDRYFQICYEEIRADQQFFQMTPKPYFRSGHLKISQDGLISLTDENFKPYRSSKNFYFDEGKLKANENWEIVDDISASSKCAKKLLMLGLFSVAVPIACKIASGDISFTYKN